MALHIRFERRWDLSQPNIPQHVGASLSYLLPLLQSHIQLCPKLAPGPTSLRLLLPKRGPPRSIHFLGPRRLGNRYLGDRNRAVTFMGTTRRTSLLFIIPARPNTYKCSGVQQAASSLAEVPSDMFQRSEAIFHTMGARAVCLFFVCGIYADHLQASSIGVTHPTLLPGKSTAHRLTESERAP